MGCACSHQLKDSRLSDTPCEVGDSRKESDFATSTHASEVDHATPSTSNLSTVEEQIEQSKVHWSTLVDSSGDMGEEEVDYRVSNEQEFRAQQRHSTWGGFFGNFTGDCISTGFQHKDIGELVVGKKFAEGAQAKLFEAQIKWNDPSNAETDKRLNREFVLKVFKEGTLLKHMMCQLPQGLLQSHVERERIMESPAPKLIPLFTSKVHGVILLKDGRFAFLMGKEHFDLRTLIERNMKLRGGEICGPFSKEEAEVMMYDIALGVEWLHNHDIVHRDLKASNILIHAGERGSPNGECHVADYECSIGVIGTSFFRAPEILHACKERKVNERPEVFSIASDVYSYAMTCYEILTGKLPFEDHPLIDRPSLLIDLVINEHLRPELPEYVEDWAHELLEGCWQFDPTSRPSIGEIINVLSINSHNVRVWVGFLTGTYGGSFRKW